MGAGQTKDGEHSAGLAIDLKNRAVYQVWVKDVLRYADLDTVGHVNSVAYAVFCENGRAAFWSQVGRPLHQPGHGIVVVHASLDYHSEMRYPGSVDVGTRVLDVGRTSMRLGYGTFQDDACSATMETVCVLVDDHGRRPIPWPDALHAQLIELSAR